VKSQEIKEFNPSWWRQKNYKRK